jgi:hypothetical protein
MIGGMAGVDEIGELLRIRGTEAVRKGSLTIL